MVARATAPNRIGPESVFPDAGTWDFGKGLRGSPMASAPFWVALVSQLVIVVGYFWFYRKEQLGELILLLCAITCIDSFCRSTPVMARSLLHLPRTYRVLFLDHGLFGSSALLNTVFGHIADNILFILRCTGYNNHLSFAV